MARGRYGHLREWEKERRVRRNYWKNWRNVRRAVEWLLKVTKKKDVSDLTSEDFRNNSLSGLFGVMDNSRYKLLTFAKYDVEGKVKTNLPKRHWWDRKNIREAVDTLTEKTGKSPNELKAHDFIDNGLAGLLTAHNSSPDRIMSLAGYDYKKWQFSRVPNRFWKNKENIKDAVSWLLDITGKDPRNLSRYDFEDNGLHGLLSIHGNSPYKALVAAGYEIKEWEMLNSPRFIWADKKKVEEAVEWLMKKTGKGPVELNQNDFRNNGLSRLFTIYRGSVYLMLLDIGYDVMPWEMNVKVWHNDPDDVSRVFFKILTRINKNIDELRKKDFERAGIRFIVFFKKNREKFKEYLDVVDQGYCPKCKKRAETKWGIFVCKDCKRVYRGITKEQEHRLVLKDDQDYSSVIFYHILRRVNKSINELNTEDLEKSDIAKTDYFRKYPRRYEFLKAHLREFIRDLPSSNKSFCRECRSLVLFNKDWEVFVCRKCKRVYRRMQ